MSSPRLPLSSRPAFLPDEISRREFATVFRGYDPSEVRTFLNQLSEQSAETADRVAEIQKALAETEERVKNPELDEEMATKLLGEQTAQILRSAREAANDTRAKAESEVSQSLREAHEVTSKMREEAETILSARTEEADRVAANTLAVATTEASSIREDAQNEADRIRADVADEIATMRAQAAEEVAQMRADAQAEVAELRSSNTQQAGEELENSRQQGRDLIETARVEAEALVQRTAEKQEELVAGLVRKRKIALAQVEELRAGRQRLLKAYKLVRGTLDEVTEELERVEDEARQAAELAGVRSAQSSELPQDELDTVVELEQYNLNDDVPQSVINLISGDEAHVADDTEPETSADPGATDVDSADSESASASESAGPRFFDQSADEDDDVVDLVSADVTTDGHDFDTFATGDLGSTDLGHTGGDSSGGGGTATAQRLSTNTQQADLAVLSKAVAVQDEQGDESAEDIRAHTNTSFIFGETVSPLAPEDMDREVQVRRDAVINKARGQAMRRLKRSMQDEQDTLVATMRHGNGHSVQALLGSMDDQSTVYQRAIVKTFRDVVRSGASTVGGEVDRAILDQTGNTAARSMAGELVEDLRRQIQPVLEEILATNEMPEHGTLQNLLSGPYKMMKADYLEQLVDDRLGGAFDQGFAMGRAAQ